MTIYTVTIESNQTQTCPTHHVHCFFPRQIAAAEVLSAQTWQKSRVSLPQVEKKNTWRQTKFGTYRNKFTYIHTVHYITLHCITLHCITLHYITLYYITLHYIHTIIYIYVWLYIYYETRSKLFISNKQKWWILLGFEKIIHNLSILAYIHMYIYICIYIYIHMYTYTYVYIYIINLYVIMDLDLLGSFSIPISCRYIHPDRTHSSISMAKRW